MTFYSKIESLANGTVIVRRSDGSRFVIVADSGVKWLVALDSWSVVSLESVSDLDAPFELTFSVLPAKAFKLIEKERTSPGTQNGYRIQYG